MSTVDGPRPHTPPRHDPAGAFWVPAATLGAAGAIAVAGPSLFPRTPQMLGIGLGAGAVLGIAGGVAAEGAARGLDEVLPGDRLVAQAALTGVGTALAAGIAIATKGRATGRLAPLQTAAMVLAAGGAAGAAATLVSRSDLPGHDGAAQAGVVAMVGAATIGATVLAVRAERGNGHLLPDLAELSEGAAGLGRLAQDKPIGSRGLLTSGGPGSPINFAKMPGQGQRFLGEMTSADEINRVMGISTAKEPIRSYVGLDHVAEVGDDRLAAVPGRIKLAMDDLEQLGAFGRWEHDSGGALRMVEPPRSHILVVAPTSSGFVNPVAASSFEFLHDGDTAIASIQVGRKKAFQEFASIPRAEASHQGLLEAVSRRIADLPEGVQKPTLHVYGESFGAWMSQNGFLKGGGISRMDELGVDSAMYVGSPSFSELRGPVTSDPALISGARPKVISLRNLPQARDLAADEAAGARITFLTHDADPVALFTPKILYEKPEWLGPPALRGENIPRRQRWLPGITAVQTTLDQQAAQSFRQGVLEAKGHDYRSEVSYVMRRAFKRPEVTDEQIVAIREWNRQLEERHAEALAAAKAAKA